MVTLRPFTSLDDLVRIKGIATARLADIKGGRNRLRCSLAPVRNPFGIGRAPKRRYTESQMLRESESFCAIFDELLA